MSCSPYILVTEQGRREVVVLGGGTKNVATDKEALEEFDEAMENE